jgi:type II secretory pathway component PulF
VPEFRYEVVNAEGVPIHGVETSDSPDALRTQLESRGYSVVSITTTKISQALAEMNQVPSRLTQLRIGETLRVAFLTQLPVAEAVRAAAREPVWNPLSSLVPWIQAASLVLLLIASAYSWSIGQINPVFVGVASFAVFMLGPVVYASRILADRPRRTLVRIAREIESGNTDVLSLTRLIPGGLSDIANSEFTEEQKSLVTAELLTSTAGTDFARHRLFLSLLGPVALFVGAITIVYGFAVLVVPGFREIFEGFGMDIPVLTQLVIGISQALESIGSSGLFVLAVCCVAVAVAFFMAVYRGWLNEALHTVPILGTGLKWANLATITRRLAIFIRNDVAPDEALRVALAQSPAADIRRDGQHAVTLLRENRSIVLPGSSLSGLPISMLSGLTSTSKDSRRRPAIASTFDGLARMFEQSVFSAGTAVASVVQFVLLVCISLLVGLTVIALFLPLIQLLNDLS